MSIQLWRSKNGFVYNGVDYEFLDVDNVTVTRNERKHKTRGANSKIKWVSSTKKIQRCPIAFYLTL